MNDTTIGNLTESGAVAVDPWEVPELLMFHITSPDESLVWFRFGK
jgi:hypothetical protein